MRMIEVRSHLDHDLSLYFLILCSPELRGPDATLEAKRRAVLALDVLMSMVPIAGALEVLMVIRTIMATMPIRATNGGNLVPMPTMVMPIMVTMLVIWVTMPVMVAMFVVVVMMPAMLMAPLCVHAPALSKLPRLNLG